jgi:hypothetical protein
MEKRHFQEMALGFHFVDTLRGAFAQDEEPIVSGISAKINHVAKPLDVSVPRVTGRAWCSEQ